MRPPDWQLPDGVNGGLWDYLHSPQVARTYDASLAGSSLFLLDETFVAEHCPTPGRLIDLGCGTGRLLATMAARGHQVVGVDLSWEMLTVARAKVSAQIDLIRANLVHLEAFADASFDHAACLFSTLGMIMGTPARHQFLGHVQRLLKPGGRFVLHIHNRWFSLWDSAGRAWLSRDLFRGTGDREMPAHQGVGGLKLHHFTRGEIVRLLREVGFRVIEVRPVSLRSDGRVPAAWWFGGLRAYGYLIAAARG